MIWPLAILTTLAIGAADYITGVSITLLQLFYLGPLVAGTWLGSRRLGLVLAVIASTCVATISFHFADDIWPTAFNTVGSAGVFLIVVLGCDRLHHYVERERRQRFAAVEQLRHADRLNVIGVLAAGVAHELGTPLNVIAGYAEMLDNNVGRTILDQTDKITRIIQHLLVFGRRANPGVTIIDLDRITVGAAELLGSTAKKRNARIDVITTEPVRVRATGTQIEQVVSNLILNALQAMPKGGTVRVSTRKDGEYGCIVVEDEGSGIAAADLPRIFDPFFTTKDVGEGTGLGLSVSYGIVQDHGGSIDVTSELGRGSRFAVKLPAA
ncbi:MAG: ATP-binding protein [Kofleriaceae bacterium]